MNQLIVANEHNHDRQLMEKLKLLLCQVCVVSQVLLTFASPLYLIAQLHPSQSIRCAITAFQSGKLDFKPSVCTFCHKFFRTISWLRKIVEKKTGQN